MIICIVSVIAVVYLIICLIIIGILNHAKAGATPCGIPIWDWLMLYFCIPIVFICLAVPVLCCLKCQSLPCVVGWFAMGIWLALIYVAFIIIYGYMLFFREDNTC